MSSVLRPVRKRKKGRTLGRVDILRREDYAALELDPKVLNRTGFLGDLIAWEDGVYGTSKSVFSGGA